MKSNYGHKTAHVSECDRLKHTDKNINKHVIRKCCLSNQLTPWNSHSWEALSYSRNSPPFMGRWSLPWARWIQSTPSHSTSVILILTVPFHLRVGLPRGLVPSDFATKILYALIISPVRATCPSHVQVRRLAINLFETLTNLPDRETGVQTSNLHCVVFYWSP
jgi:hypothetical protein